MNYIHFRHMKICYENMISYQPKCNILKLFLQDIQGIAQIILEYLPELADVRTDFDVMRSLHNAKYFDSDGRSTGYVSPRDRLSLMPRHCCRFET